ncbi:Serine/threonine-protein phosphatase 7 long form [Sesamum angolense]|uniref:Serine/threonine-protein phosphatase 7 long form n=1 Tax=Sesamum angolense TaxID=2727404 RepID=A0AAE1WZE6_9LAMI|nr:Serine/threonine-protein phosphatase 7 long form [Sesamum angolense]
MANFGPIDTSVLYGQANHRSEDVLGDPDTALTVCRGDISFFRVLQLVPRHIRVLQVLQNMSFLGILQCGHIEIDTHLITALVERWRPETHTFHFSVGEATVTLQDISIIWALPIEGNLITGVDIKWTTQQWQNYCHQWLGFRPNENAFKRSKIKLSALLDWLLNNTCDDESPFDAVLQESRICVMCIIGGILCPDATGNTVSLLYLRHMEIIDEERPSNWGTAVLAYLYRELCMASQRGKTNIGGAMQLLQIWAWSRIITLAPIPSNNAADLMPTVIDVENILPIPPYAARRGRHGEDWASFYRDYIVKWNDVQSMLVVHSEIVNGRGTVPDYMNWYHQITRVQIYHNIGSTDITGYRPTDTRDWEYVYNRMEQLVLDCDNSGDDIQSLRETRARNRAIGRDIMTFSSARYLSVRRGPAGDEAGPSNVYTPSGPSNVYNEAGPQARMLTEAPADLHLKSRPPTTYAYILCTNGFRLHL